MFWKKVFVYSLRSRFYSSVWWLSWNCLISVLLALNTELSDALSGKVVERVGVSTSCLFSSIENGIWPWSLTKGLFSERMNNWCLRESLLLIFNVLFWDVWRISLRPLGIGIALRRSAPGLLLSTRSLRFLSADPVVGTNFLRMRGMTGMLLESLEFSF